MQLYQWHIFRNAESCNGLCFALVTNCVSCRAFVYAVLTFATMGSSTNSPLCFTCWFGVLSLSHSRCDYTTLLAREELFLHVQPFSDTVFLVFSKVKPRSSQDASGDSFERVLSLMPVMRRSQIISSFWSPVFTVLCEAVQCIDIFLFGFSL